MTRKTTSDWVKEAQQVVRATLARLPEGATLKEKRAALRNAYPFGPRQYYPYRVWCKTVREELGQEPIEGPPVCRLPAPRPTGNLDLDRLLLALAADPADPVALHAVADLLEEQGDAVADALARGIRTLQPDTEKVAERLWPGCEIAMRHGGGYSPHYLEVRWKGHCRPLESLRKEIAGEYLLTNPDVTRAAQVERAILALALLSPAR